MNSHAISTYLNAIERHGTADIRTEHLGLLLTAFPVVGGGLNCIVINVDSMIVRLVQRDGLWLAQQLTIHTGCV